MKNKLNLRVCAALGVSCILIIEAFLYFKCQETSGAALLGVHAPYHAQFAESGVLMENKQWAGALSRSKELRKRMEADAALWKKEIEETKSGALLYAFNLLRIAMLEKEMGMRDAEKKTLAEFQQNAGWALGASSDSFTYDPATYSLVAESLRIGEVSLEDYIIHRLQ